MAIQFSHDFHRHWLATPAKIRNEIKSDLETIIDLLNPATQLSVWQKKHDIAESITNDTENSNKAVHNTHTSFLQKVTAGINNNDSAQHPSENLKQNDIEQNTLEETQTLHTSVSTSYLADYLKKQISETKKQISKDLSEQIEDKNTQNTLKQNTPKQSDTIENEDTTDTTAFLETLEAKVEEYLKFTMDNIKKDVMDWVKDELAQR